LQGGAWPALAGSRRPGRRRARHRVCARVVEREDLVECSNLLLSTGRLGEHRSEACPFLADRVQVVHCRPLSCSAACTAGGQIPVAKATAARGCGPRCTCAIASQGVVRVHSGAFGEYDAEATRRRQLQWPSMMAVSGGIEPELFGPYEDEETVRLVARHHHSSGDPECDAVFVLVSGHEGLTVQAYGTGITAAPEDEAPEALDSDDVAITIPDSAWRPCGNEDEPGGERGVLAAAVTVNGTYHHAVAYRVVEEAHDFQRVEQRDEDVDHYVAACGASGSFVTTTIAGAPYLVFVTPFD